MKIGIDIMGGDYAPDNTILGVTKARQMLDMTHELFLFGDEKRIVDGLQKLKAKPSDFTIIHCPETIEMGEHPAKAFTTKINSSIVIGYKYLKSGEIDGFTSAGNTGAMMVGAMQVVKSIPGVIRPGIASTLPSLNGGQTIIIDVGINPDCRPDVLFQYGLIGSIYAENVFHINKPKVGLLNIGSEESKGNLLTKSAFELMKDNSQYNFIGNIEGHDIFNNDKVDVIVCDGFVGNIILKEAETFYYLVKARNVRDEFMERFNFENYGGIPVLGINKIVIIGHGISSEIAIKNMILQAKEAIQANLSEKLIEAFK